MRKLRYAGIEYSKRDGEYREASLKTWNFNTILEISQNFGYLSIADKPRYQKKENFIAHSMKKSRYAGIVYLKRESEYRGASLKTWISNATLEIS